MVKQEGTLLSWATFDDTQTIKRSFIFLIWGPDFYHNRMARGCAMQMTYKNGRIYDLALNDFGYYERFPYPWQKVLENITCG